MHIRGYGLVPVLPYTALIKQVAVNSGSVEKNSQGEEPEADFKKVDRLFIFS